MVRGLQGKRQCSLPDEAGKQHKDVFCDTSVLHILYLFLSPIQYFPPLAGLWIKKNYKQLSALCVMQLHIFFIPKSLILIFLTKENQEQQVADSSRYISVYKQSCWCNMFTFLSDKHRADLIPPPGGVYANTCLGFSQWRWREETPAPQVLEQVDQLFHSPQLPFMDSGRSPISTHCSWKHH